jgi:hypothetical protein
MEERTQAERFQEDDDAVENIWTEYRGSYQRLEETA